MDRTRRMLSIMLATLVMLVGLLGASHAHELRFSDVTATFSEDGSYQIRLLYDLDALLMEEEEGHLTPEHYEQYNRMSFEEIRDKLERISRTINSQTFPRFDGTRTHPTIVFPDFATGRPLPPPPFTNFEKHSRQVLLTGEIPEGAKTFTWQSKEMGNTALTMKRQGSEQEVRIGLSPDEQGPPFHLFEDTPEPPRLQTMKRYFLIGFEHIIPDGIDHILFVLGLFLLTERLRPLFWQITAFTIAHSVTLGLAIYDVFALNEALVEAIVALSIAYVAIENIFTKEMKWWRPCVVFMFGLLHGLTFAGGLKEIGLPQGQFLLSLFTFNIGVEIGHIAVVVLAFLAVGWFRHKDWYRARIVLPVSCIIGIVALYWATTRFWGILFG